MCVIMMHAPVVTQVVATLVSEIALCVKEVNQKTRAAAYGLLVDLGQAMHEADPPSLPSLDTHMGGLDLKGVPAQRLPLPLLAAVCPGDMHFCDTHDCQVQSFTLDVVM